MGEKTKDTLETAANVVLTIAGAAGAAVAGLPGGLGLAYGRFHHKRVRRWWDLVADRNRAPEDLAARIETGLAEDDEHVVAGVVGGARAASSAIELAAVVVIAELSRRFLHERDLPKWFYRGALALFEQLEAAELGALRRLLREIEPIRSESILIAGDIDGEAQPWRAAQLSVAEPFEVLTPFASPSRLFGYIKRVGLGYDSRGVAYVGSPRHVVMDRDVATWLREAM